MMLSLFFISIKVLKPLAFVLDCAREPYIPVVPIVCSIDVHTLVSLVNTYKTML